LRQHASLVALSGPIVSGYRGVILARASHDPSGGPCGPSGEVVGNVVPIGTAEVAGADGRSVWREAVKRFSVCETHGDVGASCVPKVAALGLKLRPCRKGQYAFFAVKQPCPVGRKRGCACHCAVLAVFGIGDLARNLPIT
jgi:hypothetical protein